MYPNIIFIIKVVLYIFFVLVSGYFAGIETALLRFSASQLGLDNKVKKYITIWETNPAMLLSSILIGTNLACVGIGVLSESLNINIIYSTLLLLVMGEILPKIYSLSKPADILNFGLDKLVWFSSVVQPISNFLVNISLYITSIILAEKPYESPFLTAKELEELIKSDETVTKDEQNIYTNVISLADKRVYEIMVPKEDIVAVDYSSAMEQIIQQLSNTKYSRIPVFKDTLDNIVGVIYTKDITVAIQNKELIVIDDIIRPPYFVINTAKVIDILKQFKQGKHHLAIVIDEYGATVGLVTIEDIIEEIFGEIYDEYDIREEKVTYIGDNTFIILGDETLKNLSEFLNIDFEPTEVATLSGYIITQLGYVPKRGERIYLKNMQLEIIDADNKVIKKIKLKVITPQEELNENK